MGNVLVQEAHLRNIAAAIRAKNGSANTYTPAQMGPAVQGLGGAIPKLGKKTISYNGTVSAAEDGLDGYSVVAVSRAANLPVYAYDITNGFVSVNSFYVGESKCYSDVYRVKGGRKYWLRTGGTVGNCIRSTLIEKDPTTASSTVVGTRLTSVESPRVNGFFGYGIMKADGYLVVTKDSAGTSGLKTYLFDVTLREDVT